MLRQGNGEPVVLLHGILDSERDWTHVVPLLARDHEAIALTMLGHRGGREPESRPVAVDDLVDDVERQMDEVGAGRAHLAGNSLGGWVSLELARRGRALSVCALSPAGVWSEDRPDFPRVVGLLRAAVKETHRGRRLVPLLSYSARFRRRALAVAAAHGDRIGRADFLAAVDDLLGCTVHEDIFESGGLLAPLDPVPCPVTIAWSEKDRVFPVDGYGAKARELVPQAEFKVLDDVGHVPMYDDPQLVADTIRATALSAS